MLLKLIAWDDRHLETPHHDAVDIRTLITSYAESWNIDHLYGEGADLLERFGFDVDRSAAALLGRDMAAIARPKTLEGIRVILEREVADDAATLATDMDRLRIDENLTLLEAVLSGVGYSP